MATDSAAESGSVSQPLPSNATLYGFPRTLLDALDARLGPATPCGLCSDTILGQRHRIIDAITERLRAGELDAGDDYGIKERDLWVVVMASYEHDKALARQRRAERKAQRDV